MGEKVFCTGEGQTFADGQTFAYGQQGEVVGAATGDESDTHVVVLFPGNEDGVECDLATVCRIRTASAAHPPPPRRLGCYPHPECPPYRDSLCLSASAPPASVAAHAVAQRSGSVRAGERWAWYRWAGWQRRRGQQPSPHPPYGWWMCAGEPRCTAADAGRLQSGREGVPHGGEPDL